MAANHIAYTAPINPPSATPVLTISQVWAGLEIKIRNAQDFVPIIETTDVLEEYHEGNIPVTVRELVFKEGERPNPRVRETCKAYEPMKVDFYMDNGSVVSNVISEGSGGAEKGDLNMTYVFVWKHPELEGDEAGLRKAREKVRAMAKLAVESSIEAIRRMVVEGRIKT